MYTRLRNVLYSLHTKRPARIGCQAATIVRHSSDQTHTDNSPPANDRPKDMTIRHAKQELRLVQQILGLQDGPILEAHFKDVVFVCIDCEAYERAQHIITEIGVAVLDTLDLQDVERKRGAEYLTARIKATHIRPIEHSTLVNRQFVKGREEHFNFGLTQWIKYKDYSQMLQRLFQSPTDLDGVTQLERELPTKTRNIVLVAHDLKADSRFMATAGFSTKDATNVVHTIDTQIVARGTKKQQIGLRRLLHVLEINAFNLHNAGNDAFYTLQALVTMAVKEHANPSSYFTAMGSLDGQKPPLPVNIDNGSAPRGQGTAKPRRAPREAVDESISTAVELNQIHPSEVSQSSRKRRAAEDDACPSQTEGLALKKPARNENASQKR